MCDSPLLLFLYATSWSLPIFSVLIFDLVNVLSFLSMDGFYFFSFSLFELKIYL